jgi:hypothetical protein
MVVVFGQLLVARRLSVLSRRYPTRVPCPPLFLQNRLLSNNFVEQKIASQQYTEMKRLVDAELSVSQPDQIRQCFWYWLGKHTNSLASRRGTPSLPVSYAGKILDYLLSEQPQLLPFVVSNLHFHRMVSLHLQPFFQGTLRSLKETGRRNSFHQNSDALQALSQAAEVCKIMQSLHEDPKHVLLPDTLSQKALLQLWSARVKFLSKSRTETVHDMTARDCINAIKVSIKNNNELAREAATHNLLITSLAHCGLADEALEHLQQMQVKDESHYNTGM